MAARVFVFGSINTDLVVYVAHLPRPGETIGGGTYQSFPGGKGANQAVAAARAGAAVQLYGCLGDDAFGRERLASLEETGVSTGGVRVLPGVASGVAGIKSLYRPVAQLHSSCHFHSVNLHRDGICPRCHWSVHLQSRGKVDRGNRSGSGMIALP